MSDEEIKAIEYLKRHIIPCYGRKGTIEFMLNDIVLNLIEKQSKEIEELKDKNKKLEDEEIKIRAKFILSLDNYIGKDKIKAKIEFIKSLKEKFYYEENVISILQSLLEKE